MNIVIAGGSGFIGRALSTALHQHHHGITVLSRDPARASATRGPTVAVVGWDVDNPGPWQQAIEEADAVVNLAGEPVAEKRWTPARKEALRRSRLSSTYALVEAIKRATPRPRVLISASGVGYYGARDAMPVTEATPRGGGFLAELSADWEHEASQAAADGVRVVLLRIGMVLGRDGGALGRMVPLFKRFLGGPIPPGYQWVSWIHLKDLVALIEWAIGHDGMSGPVNAVSPNPVTMSEFCRTLARVLRRPSWLPIPELALRLGLGEMSSMLTTGQRAEPRAVTNEGFAFKFPNLAMALHDVLDRPVNLDSTTGGRRDSARRPPAGAVGLPDAREARHPARIERGWYSPVRAMRHGGR